MDAWPTCLPQRNKTTTVHLRVPQWQSKVPGILSFFHSFYPEFELWLSFLPETRIKTLILSKLTWLAVHSSFSAGNTSWHDGFSSQWFIAICIVFSIKKSRKLSICPLFYSVWHLVSFNILVSLNFKQQDTKTLGFSIPEKNKAQEYPRIYSCFFAAFYIHGT